MGKSKNTSVTLYEYGNVPLKVYVEIASGSPLEKLIINGSPSREQLVEAWETIVTLNGKNSGNFQYDAYKRLYIGYWNIIAKHLVIRASLLKLCFVIDYETVQDVRSRGYALSLDSSEAYKDTLVLGLTKSENLITRAELRKNEIERDFPKAENNGSSLSFDKVMAELSIQIAPTLVTDDITLSRYNEYLKIIRERNKSKEANSNKARTK